MLKGIILAGGSGTRLRPLTDFVCKQLLPVYDKPLIYYPLTLQILAGIKKILIVSTPEDLPSLKKALGDGSRFGISLAYEAQAKPNGIAEALLIGEQFIGKDKICLMLGDNILHVSNFPKLIKPVIANLHGATIFGFPVKDPSRYGVVTLNQATGKVISLEEKPSKPKSNLAAVGLYIYDNTAIAKAKKLKPSMRGELEITDVNKAYLKQKKLECIRLSRGNVWMDVGVFDAFSDASNLIRLFESRLGLKIGCPEEAAYICGNITKQELLKAAKMYHNSIYGEYLRGVCR